MISEGNAIYHINTISKRSLTFRYACIPVTFLLILFANVNFELVLLGNQMERVEVLTKLIWSGDFFR